MDVGVWLRELGLDQYEQAFRENDIDAEVLRELDQADLERLGIASLGHRKRLLKAIVALRGVGEERRHRFRWHPSHAPLPRRLRIGPPLRPSAATSP